MAISIEALEWIVKVNDELHNDLWNDLQRYDPFYNHAAAEKVFEHHACVESIRDCLALSRQYRDEDDRPQIINEQQIIDRLRKRYREVHFASALAKAHGDLAERDDFATRNR
jgi:hypothetical protein